MSRTAEMKLLELMVLKNDISSVIEYIGKKENFQFQSRLKDSAANAGESAETLNVDSQFYDGLKKAATELGYEDSGLDIKSCGAPIDADRKQAADLIAAFTD